VITTVNLIKFPDTATSLTLAASGKKHSRSGLGTVNQATLLPKKKLKQGSLMDHAYRGVDMPFSSSKIATVQAQALWAAISANLSF
jgi:hypothetical protein